MAEFFRPPVLGFFLRSIDAFPAERDRADLKTIRTAIDRLKSGRIVGFFPEGGIRDGARSLLEGAPLRPGAATLAQIADVPILPCVFSVPIGFIPKNMAAVPAHAGWIAFGKPVSSFPELQKSQARERIESELAAAFKNLYAELREKFRLTADDLPQSPQERAKQLVSRAARPVATLQGNAAGSRLRSLARNDTLRSRALNIRFASVRIYQFASSTPPAEWAQSTRDGALPYRVRAAHAAGILRPSAGHRRTAPPIQSRH